MIETRRTRLVRKNAALGADLERLASAFHYDRSLLTDPLHIVRRYAKDPRAAEITGLFASTVAVGNVKTILRAMEDLLGRMGGDPRGFVEGFDPVRWRDVLDPWKHRWIRADQMGFLALRLQEIYRRHPGGLEEVFLAGVRSSPPGPGPEFAGGLDALSRALRWGSTDASPTFYEPPPGYQTLFPTPLNGHGPTCKRLSLFLRWMVRRRSPDLGLWRSVSPSILHVPLDTHVYWIARHAGLTRRRTRSWRTVVEITERLRAWDPEDPVRFDFALAHTGISGDCPKRRDVTVCGRCALQSHCDLWRSVRSLPRQSQNSRVFA